MAACASDNNIEDKAEFFESQIRPLLVKHCYECHNSLDAQEGGLSLDYRGAMEAGGDSGALIDSQNSRESLLLRVVRHELPGLEMPQGGAKLSAEEIDALTRWVVDGAFDPRENPPNASELEQATSWSAIAEKRREWWSFQPLRQYGVPQVTNTEWSTDPIDRFLLAAMEREGLVPAEDAPREALVRRVAFVLTGLPPTPAEVAAFVADKRPSGYEELVDYYLKSPGFGEHWARHWMDWIRYAESHGSEGDPAIPDAWRYRDYLIRALNADVPCDQLIREHIAGDLIAEDRYNSELKFNESPIGTSQLRMVFHGFAPTDAQDERVRFTDDAINTITKAFLGLTVSCARCHDHKFDPISQEDYFALYGVFTNPRPGRLVIDSEEKQRHNYDGLVKLKKEVRDTVSIEWQARIDSLDTAAIGKLIGLDLQAPNLRVQWGEANQKWRTVQARRDDNERARLNGGAEGVVDLAGGRRFANWYRYGLGVNENLKTKSDDLIIALEGEKAIAAVLPEGVASHRVSSKHAGVFTSPDFVAQPGQVLWLLMAGDGNATSRYVVENYPRDGTVYPTTTWQATSGGTRWRWQRYDIGYWAGDTVHVEITTARDAPVLDRGNERSGFAVRDCLLISGGGSPEEATAGEEFLPFLCSTVDEPDLARSSEVLSQYLRQIIGDVIDRWRSGDCSDEDVLLLDRLLREGILENRLEQLDAVAPLVQRYRSMEAEIAVPTRITGVLETEGRNARLMLRGDHKNLADEVPRRFLSVCGGMAWASSSSGRLELADEMVRASNPLTPRVMVNRVWHHVFGKGLVETPDNVGRLGSEPSHPELLDYLARQFLDDQWSLQRLVRSLVLTRAFRLSVQANERADQVDPGNRWLSHASIRRLEAESIRDGMLAVSGILDRTLFGTPVENAQRRRSVYLPVRRNSLEPLLRVFDFPEPFSCTGRRDVTNVPAQALTLLNSPDVSQWAEQWARSVANDAQLKNDQQRAQGMWRTAFGRLPTVAEWESIQLFLSQQELARQQFMQQRAALMDGKRSLLDEQAKLWSEAKQRLPVGESDSVVSVSGRPVMEWNYRELAIKEAERTELQTVGDAVIDADGLHVSGNGYAISTPIAQQVGAKTFEAVVKLSHYDQGGGGVLSLQSRDGVIFDAIVYGEREPRQWMAGSNGFERTQSFAGENEQEAVDQPVHLAIVYDAEGNVRAFRNGIPYGSVYRARSPVVFGAGESVVTLGLRHLPSGGNRMLSGTIYHARVWDRALTADEVHQLASGAVGVVTRKRLESLLTEEELVRLHRTEETLRSVEEELKQLPVALAEDDKSWRWAELAKAIFNMKEFIYLP